MRVSQVTGMLIMASLLLNGADSSVHAQACSRDDLETGNCTVERDDDGRGLTAGGTEESQGNPGSDDGDSGGDDDGSGNEVEAGPPAVVPFDPEDCFRGSDNLSPNMYCPQPGEDPLPVITIRDLVRFVPSDSTIAGEPNNLGVAGLATNFVANAQATVVEATLFNRLISVEFTPVEYDFDYGDGAAASHATGGASWESLGLAQFTPTDTSHVYLDRGTYTASITVDYTARINFGFGWLPVEGTVAGPSASQSIQIFEARTALVDRTCDEDPKAAGC